MLNAPSEGLPKRIAELLDGNRELEAELRALRREAAVTDMTGLVEGAAEVAGVRVAASLVQPTDMDGLRDMADRLREALGSGVGVLGAELNGKAALIAVVTDDLVRRGVQAGGIVKEAAKVVGGGGGGKPHMAQAGGRSPEKLEEALAHVPDIVNGQLGA